MLAAILVSLAVVWTIGIVITIYEVARAPIGPDNDDRDNPDA